MTITIAQIRQRLEYIAALRGAVDRICVIEREGRISQLVCVCCGVRCDISLDIGEMKHQEGCSVIQLLSQADFTENAMVGATVVER